MKIKTLISILALSTTSISLGETHLTPNKIYTPIEVVVSIPKPTIAIDPIRYIDKVISQELKPTKLITKSFVKKIILMESNYDSTLIGSSGERGLMQLMEDTYNSMSTSGFDSAFYVRPNLRAGIRLLKQLEHTLAHDHPEWNTLSKIDKLKAIGAAYNGGLGLLSRNNYDVDLMKPHTIRYINKIN